MIAFFVVCLIAFAFWYLEKRIRWEQYRTSVRAYTVGLVTGAGFGDTGVAASYAEKYLDQVETKIKIPRKTAFPLCNSNNYAEFALICMIKYAEENDFPELSAYCSSVRHTVRPYWDGYSLE